MRIPLGLKLLGGNAALLILLADTGWHASVVAEEITSVVCAVRACAMVASFLYCIFSKCVTVALT